MKITDGVIEKKKKTDDAPKDDEADEDAEALGRPLEGLVEHHRAASRRVGERVGDGGRGLHPLEAVAIERQLPEERGQDPHRVDGGADVVLEAREREGRGAGAAPRLVVGLEHQHPSAGALEGDGGREPVRA